MMHFESICRRNLLRNFQFVKIRVHADWDGPIPIILEDLSLVDFGLLLKLQYDATCRKDKEFFVFLESAN